MYGLFCETKSENSASSKPPIPLKSERCSDLQIRTNNWTIPKLERLNMDWAITWPTLLMLELEFHIISPDKSGDLRGVFVEKTSPKHAINYQCIQLTISTSALI